jgi:UDP-sulfoquinovose synthase
VECIRLACENPAAAGEFRVFNQMTEAMSVEEIAKTVAECYPGPAEIEYLDNPRVELDTHYYNVVHTGLVDLGLEPHRLCDTLITSLFATVERHRQRVDLAAMRPTVSWRATASSPNAR